MKFETCLASIILVSSTHAKREKTQRKEEKENEKKHSIRDAATTNQQLPNFNQKTRGEKIKLLPPLPFFFSLLVFWSSNSLFFSLESEGQGKGGGGEESTLLLWVRRVSQQWTPFQNSLCLKRTLLHHVRNFNAADKRERKSSAKFSALEAWFFFLFRGDKTMNFENKWIRTCPLPLLLCFS